MTDHDFKELNKKYFLITKTRFWLLIAVFTASMLATWVYMLTDNRAGIATSVVSDDRDATIHYSKTFVFWIPKFAAQDSLKEQAFNKYITDQYGGLSRWEVEGYYNGERQRYIKEQGWNYQISLEDKVAAVTSAKDIQHNILKRYFPKEESYYITEIKNSQ